MSRNNWERVRETVLDRDGHACRFCGVTDAEHREESDGDHGLHVHHVIPKRDGGTDHPDNLVAVCASCHRTLEETHGKAVAQMKRREDYGEDLNGVTQVWREQKDRLARVEDRLAEFVTDHPTFAREFNIYTTSDGVVEAPPFGCATATSGDVRIRSEWEFAAGWGYKEGLTDAVVALNESTAVPFTPRSTGEDSATHSERRESAHNRSGGRRDHSDVPTGTTSAAQNGASGEAGEVEADAPGGSDDQQPEAK